MALQRLSTPYLRGGLIGLCLAAGTAAVAHLMVAQHGTIEIVGEEVFMVVSVPVSAFDGIDDDRDGDLSAAEFQAHRKDIEAKIVQGIRLLDTNGTRPLKALMFGPTMREHIRDHDDDRPPTANQLVVMGRFALADANTPLRLEVFLFGDAADEQSLEIRVTRRSTNERRIVSLSPDAPSQSLF